MNPLVSHREVTTPAGYAERECFLVSYRLPLCRHCFALCHDPRDPDHPSIDPDTLGFFMAQAHALSERAVGNAHSFVAIHSGGFMRRRHNLHLHVFVLRRRGQKAWLYTMLALFQASVALRAAWQRLSGRHGERPFVPRPARAP